MTTTLYVPFLISRSCSDGDDLSTSAYDPVTFQSQEHTYQYALSGDPSFSQQDASLPSPQLSFGYAVPHSFSHVPQPDIHTHSPPLYLAPGDTYTNPTVALYSPVQNLAGPAPSGAIPDAKRELLEVHTRAPRELGPKSSEILKGRRTRRATTAPETDRKVETQRKARQRIVAESIGFPPTDPDTISSHDKKRYYLECLEQYVSYLHEQLTLVGHKPIPLERVSSYRGLTTRSIRTMMVSMEGVVRQAHQETLEEERNFLLLREELMALESESNDQYPRQHLASA
ncbi:hypothetical protein BV25DRAFT_1928531 [Artomyces pyxidatus]|uniref:Uncharacterized protein n=1 Tax=Artomyces pyxidatus TaxID=48021 RepID=A0ACB8SGS3_9AGAM|nr:hypothetical protein BV25DRAFT_1928531 [Artomyces pyxidatus]